MPRVIVLLLVAFGTVWATPTRFATETVVGAGSIRVGVETSAMVVGGSAATKSDDTGLGVAVCELLSTGVVTGSTTEGLGLWIGCEEIEAEVEEAWGSLTAIVGKPCATEPTEGEAATGQFTFDTSVPAGCEQPLSQKRPDAASYVPPFQPATFPPCCAGAKKMKRIPG